MGDCSTKRCSKCGKDKPANQFYKNIANKSGLSSWCRSCKRNKVGQYNKKHLGIRRERNRRYYHANPQNKLIKAKNYRNNNIEREKQKSKRYREANLDKEHKRGKKYYQSHKAEFYQRVRLRIARKANAEGSFTKQDIDKKRKAQKGRCYYCGQKAKLTVDHIVPLSRGGSNWPSNIVLACGVCNSKKHNKLLHEWAEGGRLI